MLAIFFFLYRNSPLLTPQNLPEPVISASNDLKGTFSDSSSDGGKCDRGRESEEAENDQRTYRSFSSLNICQCNSQSAHDNIGAYFPEES